MSDELQTPSVIDLDALLQPIPGENPSGESLRYSGIYDEMSEARRADENLSQGEWRTELKVADYRRVIELGLPALTNQTKDLQIGVWLSEALVKQHGFAGFRDTLKLLTGFQQNFWETLHPEIDEGDMEARANAIAWFDAQIGFALQEAPFTGNLGYSLINWQDSRRFDIPENMDSLGSDEKEAFTKLKAQAEAERRVTSEMWRREIATSRRAACEKNYFLLEECKVEFAEFNRTVDEKFDRNQVPGLSVIKKVLDDVDAQLKKLLEEKRAEEPDEIEEVEVSAEGEAGEGGEAVARSGGTGSGGPIQTRKDALKRLAEIAAYFQRTEPHSPVSYLIQRAVKWGNMPLENWLQDVIKDESIIFQLRQTLGFNTDNDDSSGG